MKRDANNGSGTEGAVANQALDVDAVAVEFGQNQFQADLAASRGGGFDAFQQRASDVFKTVQNPEGWKHAVDAVVDVDATTLGFLLAAVTFFTGSVPTYERVAGGFRVRAAGYYAAVGA